MSNFWTIVTGRLRSELCHWGVKAAFEAFGRDYEQVRGSVSVILEGFLVDLMLIFRTHPWLCS